MSTARTSLDARWELINVQLYDAFPFGSRKIPLWDSQLPDSATQEPVPGLYEARWDELLRLDFRQTSWKEMKVWSSSPVAWIFSLTDEALAYLMPGLLMVSQSNDEIRHHLEYIFVSNINTVKYLSDKYTFGQYRAILGALENYDLNWDVPYVVSSMIEANMQNSDFVVEGSNVIEEVTNAFLMNSLTPSTSNLDFVTLPDEVIALNENSLYNILPNHLVNALRTRSDDAEQLYWTLMWGDSAPNWPERLKKKLTVTQFECLKDYLLYFAFQHVRPQLRKVSKKWWDQGNCYSTLSSVFNLYDRRG